MVMSDPKDMIIKITLQIIVIKTQTRIYNGLYTGLLWAVLLINAGAFVLEMITGSV